MAATIRTVSPGVPVRELERRTRARVDRDGIAVLAAASGDQRQLRHLRRLAHSLASDGRFDCYLAETIDDDAYIDDSGEVVDATAVVEVTQLTVFLRSERQNRRGLGWVGEARLG
jgi:hypothetical protein